MDYSKKQQELDVIKWVDSESKNYDTCGEYSYCKNCNKSKEYPCAYAYEYYKANNTTQKATKSTSTAKKAVKTAVKSTKSKSTTSGYKTSTPKTVKTKTSTSSAKFTKVAA